MSEEDISFLISIQSLEQPEFDNACLERENKKKEKEIERLKEELEYTIPIVEHNKTITKHLKEIERLHSIIKEVREYAKDNQFTAHLNIQTNKVTKIENGEMTDILEILGEKN